MGSVSKTDGTSVLALQSVAASSVLISSALDVSTKFAASLFIHFGRRIATAAGAGVNLRVEASSKASGNGHWYPLAILTTDFQACEAEAVTGTVNAGATVITCASTTNLTAGDLIYIDNGTIANSEWARIKSISVNVSVTIEDALTFAQTGATMYDRAEMYAVQLDLTAVKRIRLVADGALYTQAFAIESTMVTGDSFS
jgi:hypothetical protein